MRLRPCRALVLAAASTAAAAASTSAALPKQLPPFTIAPGVVMPAVSVGHPDDNCTHGRGPGCAAAAQNETALWLGLGGRGIDTANDYANQQFVGAAIRAAIAWGGADAPNRSSIFVTTKVSPNDCTSDAALAAVKSDLQQLGLKYVDLVLQHFPCKTDAENQEMWKGLVKAQDQGLTRAIGVSHFSQVQLESIMYLQMVTPSVNQCEMCVGDHDDATIKFCQAHNITYQSFGALRSVDLSDSRLTTIGACSCDWRCKPKKGSSSGRASLRWAVGLLTVTIAACLVCGGSRRARCERCGRGLAMGDATRLPGRSQPGPARDVRGGGPRARELHAHTRRDVHPLGYQEAKLARDDSLGRRM
eukprot:SAG11_NODE_838_length_6918_cov_3.566945_6_plen_360_part_00